MFWPVKIRPFAMTAAPTAKPEYGAYALSIAARASRTASSISACPSIGVDATPRPLTRGVASSDTGSEADPDPDRWRLPVRGAIVREIQFPYNRCTAGRVALVEPDALDRSSADLDL